MQKLIIVLVLLGGVYGLYLYGTRNSDVVLTESVQEEPSDTATEVRNLTFKISGEEVVLQNGVGEVKTDLSGDSVSTVRYFGNELEHDINGDGMMDVVFLVTQESGGSGTFFYAVGAIQQSDGSLLGSEAVLIADRIAPQNTEAGEGRQVIVNYADRAPGEPMTTPPSVGKSLHLLFDEKTMQFGEVVQNFEGESM